MFQVSAMSDAPATLDPTKKPAGAMTMVYQDYYFLQRWVDYYGRQFGREHLYILSLFVTQPHIPLTIFSPITRACSPCRPCSAGPRRTR